MRMIWLIILILALSEGECDRPQILTGTSYRQRKFDSLMESTVLSLLSCYDNKVDTVGGIEISDPTLVNILMTKQPLPVKLFGQDERRAAPHQTLGYSDYKTHKLHLFVAETSPIQQFVPNFLRIINSQASPQLPTFLIIEWPSQNNQKSCSKALDYLWHLWIYQTLHAFYVCVDNLEERVSVYTYNPYKSQAPAPWILDKTFKGSYDHPWSLFVRENRPGNQQICNNLDFVKTHDLGGYNIPSLYWTDLPISPLTTQYAKNLHSSTLVDLRVARLVFKALNATPDLYLIGSDGNKFVASYFREMITQENIRRRADIYLNPLPSIYWGNHMTSIAFTNLDYVVVTRHISEKSQLDKLIGVFDGRTRFGICLVIIATLLFFALFMREPLGTAAINVVRIIGYTGLLRVPNENAPRLYLAGVFILVVTIIGVYQGLLAALLTKPILLPEINTFEELADSPHKIYIENPIFTKFFSDSKFNGRLKLQEKICRVTDRGDLLIRPLDACLIPRINAIRIAIKQNLHISRETIVPANAAYQLRVNWALEKRFNEILASFMESHILWYVNERTLERVMEIAEYKEKLEKERPVVMKLGDLGFAFAFLGIGLSLATIVLVIEIAMKRRQLQRRKTRPGRQPGVDKKRKTQIPTVECVAGPSNLP